MGRTTSENLDESLLSRESAGTSNMKRELREPANPHAKLEARESEFQLEAVSPFTPRGRGEGLGPRGEQRQK